MCVTYHVSQAHIRHNAVVFSFHSMVLLITIYCISLPCCIFAGKVDYTSNWLNGSPLLPRSESGMAVGEYNGSLFLLGGTPDKRQLMEYNIYANKFIDHGVANISVDLFGFGNFYSQRNEILYLIDPEGTKFSVFNLKTKQFSYHWNSINFPSDVTQTWNEACLASDDMSLYIVGGYNNGLALSKLYVLNISNNSWLSNTPSMHTARRQPGCIICPVTDQLFIWGGTTSAANSWHLSVEKIYVLPDIVNFQYNQQDLLVAVQASRGIIYGNHILVMGGYNGGFSITVQIIDCITGIIVNGGQMSYKVSQTAAIMYDEIVYLFGGAPLTNKWQYYNLPPTSAPTPLPSLLPSTLPTISPTPACNSISVFVMNANNQFDENNFDGLYALKKETTIFNRPVWMGSQLGITNVRNIQFSGTNWVINGFGHGVLSTLFAGYFPPINNTKLPWFHSFLSGNFHVSLQCGASYTPTTTPTTSPSESTDISKEPSDETAIFKDEYVAVIIVSALILIIVIISIFIYKDHKRKTARNLLTMYVSHPMVLAISIGEYDENPDNPDFDGICDDLEGINTDTLNMYRFAGHFQYEMFPKIYDPKYDNIKTRWTEHEVMSLLRHRAEDLEKNINKYDGLIVVISCHGIADHVVTSDYKLINKTVINRVFSADKPMVRKIPRFFLYDCCNGDHEKDREYRDQIQNEDLKEEEKHGDEQGKEIKTNTINEMKKKTTLEDVEGNHVLWARGEDNPDFQLITVHAANIGFVSKMDVQAGSYVITKFVNKTIDNIERNNNKKWLFEIFDEIQKELHDANKQQTVNIFNNNTRYLKFRKNKKHNKVNDGEVQIEYSEQEIEIGAISEIQLDNNKMH